jgi:hypothetical protein
MDLMLEEALKPGAEEAYTIGIHPSNFEVFNEENVDASVPLSL